ncbi:MAG: hypothetical protein OEY14_12915, partial [Myxococcales bacterium]|nr:hypothetical protein [Myxococcales bacterium]
DRPGLLHAIAGALHAQGVSIGLSKVHTQGERVADVFYVEDPAGGKLRDPMRLAALRAGVFGAIEALQAGAEQEDA